MSKELRDASNDAEALVRDFGVESSMRLDVYQAKVAAEKNIKDSGEWDKLSSEKQRLVDKMILDGTRDGLGLPEKERTELMALKKELSQTCLEFSVSRFHLWALQVDSIADTSTEKFQRRESKAIFVFKSSRLVAHAF